MFKNIERVVCPFSEHHSVNDVTFEAVIKHTAYWIFDANLLKSDTFNT